MKEIQLSSNWTKFGVYVSLIVAIAIIPVLITALISNKEFHTGMLVASILYLFILYFITYQFRYSCSAKIRGNKLILKKQLQPEVAYDFDKIDSISSFQLKTTRYITVKMKNRHNTIDKYLILNSRSILAFENKNAETVLKSLKQNAAAEK